MGDFFVPVTGSTPPPPEPDIPAPDFGDIGAKIWTGAAAAAGELGGVEKWGDWILHIIAKIVGFLLSLLVKVFAYIIELIDTALDYASDSFGNIISATLKSLFDVDVPASSLRSRRGSSDSRAAAIKIGKTITDTMFSAAQAVPGGGITPSDSAAFNYLSVVMNMEFNGWIESFFTDGLSGHILEKYGDLKDSIARALGLGRLSRRAFAPPMRILVEEPYTALLNQKYRPKSSNEQQVIKAFFRGEFDETELSRQLGNQGYTEQQIKWSVLDAQLKLPLQDIDWLLARGVWTDNDAQQYLQTDGYTFADAQHITSVLNDRRTFKYRVEMLQVAEAAFVRGDMDQGTFESVVSTLSLPADEQTWVVNVATLKRSTKVTHLSLAQIEKGIKDGVMSFEQLNEWAARENMPIDELTLLQLSIQVDVNKQSTAAKAKADAAKAKAEASLAKQQAAQQKADLAKAQAADKGISASEAETLVLDGLWTFDQLRSFLTSRGYGPDAIESIVLVLHDKLNKAAAKASTAGTVRAQASGKGLSLAETEKAVIAGIIPIEDLQQLLSSQGYDSESVQVLVDLTQQAADAAKVKRDAKAAAEAKAAARQLSLADLERAVRAGLTTIATYQAALQAAGFDQMSITLLTGLLNDQIAADQAAAAKKATTGGKTTARGVTLAQLEQEIIAGIRPISDYTAELQQLGYGAADVQDLSQLLQLRIEQAAVTAAHRAAAEAKLNARDVSISQAERAVKLSVMPIAEYQKLLAADGFTQHAIDVLSNTLLAEVAQTRKAQQAANTAAGTLARKGISLPDLERAVIAGIQPIADYTATLTSEGYSQQDAQTLTDLLQLKLDASDAAKAAHADAEGNATQRGISLAAEEQAVIAGDKTIDDYDALLAALGYDAVDRATLEFLLQQKLDAKAAKDAGGTPSTSGNPTG